MRSGTNWVCSLLNLHPQINCIGEFHFEMLCDALAHFTEEPWTFAHHEAAVAKAAAEGLSAAIRSAMLAAVKYKPDALWIGDRTPSSLQYLPLPEAPCIYAVRDGRDVLVSWTYHQLRIGGLQPGWSERLADQVKLFQRSPAYFKENPQELLRDLEWVDCVARGWAEHYEWWRRRTSDQPDDRGSRPILTVRYEDLLRDADKARSELYRFLELDPGDAAPLSRETNTLPGHLREDPLSFYRRGIQGEWREYFTDPVCACFKEAAGDALVGFGYEKDSAW